MYFTSPVLVETEEEKRELQKRYVHVLRIHKNVTKAALSAIWETVPSQPQLDYVKTIRRCGDKGHEEDVEILVCTAESSDPVVLQVKLASLISDQFAIKTIPVPMHAPVTLAQAETWSRLWPVDLREYTDRRLFKAVASEEAHVSQMKEHLLKCLESARNNLPIATLIVNPTRNLVIASAVDSRLSSNRPHHHSIIDCILQVGEQLSTQNGDGYLCLNLDVYTTHEPCAMCAMALVHSRIRRLVFCRRMTQTGHIIGHNGQEGMHWHKLLNHRYAAYEMPAIDAPFLDIPEAINA